VPYRYFYDTVPRVAAGKSLSKIETELAVLTRTLEGLSRRSEIHREVDRSSYLIARTLATDGATSIGGLATTLGLDATTVTRQVASMESAGLVVRRTDPEDGRVRLIELSARGERKMREVQRAREQRISGLVAGWSPADRRSFGDLLARFNDSLLQRGPDRTVSSP
jgi:DNA-binding MarR family transcriptional regulator